MSKRRATSVRPARRAIEISAAVPDGGELLARVMRAGRAVWGDWTSTWSLEALASTMKPPSRRDAMAGRGVRASRDHSVRQARAFRPRSLAHRIISDAPNLSGSQPMAELLAIGRHALQVQQHQEGLGVPGRLEQRGLGRAHRRYSGTRGLAVRRHGCSEQRRLVLEVQQHHEVASSPGSAGAGGLGDGLTDVTRDSRLGGQGVRLREQRRLVRGRIGHWCAGLALARPGRSSRP